eukprot:gene22443-1327_t
MSGSPGGAIRVSNPCSTGEAPPHSLETCQPLGNDALKATIDKINNARPASYDHFQQLARSETVAAFHSRKFFCELNGTFVPVSLERNEDCGIYCHPTQPGLALQRLLDVLQRILPTNVAYLQ